MGLAALAGFGAEILVGSDYTSGITIGIAFYLASYYLARFTWYKHVATDKLGKIYSTGVGGFIMVFLFSWMLFFTLQISGYPP